MTMEDQYFIGDGGRVTAVFDGHGGADVARYLRGQFFARLQKHLRRKQWEEQDDDSSSTTPTPPYIPPLSSHVTALRSALQDLESEVLARRHWDYQGSTAAIVTLHQTPDGHRTLVSANLGDSRAVLSRNGTAVNLTRDHKPDDPLERNRILSLGEMVEWDNYAKVHRVRNLSLSRAIGDKDAKPYVSPDAEIQHFPVMESSDEFVVVASDGLWDVMTSQEAVEFVQQYMEPPHGLATDDIQRLQFTRRKNVSRHLAREALKRGSGDNICVVTVWLQPLDYRPSYTT